MRPIVLAVAAFGVMEPVTAATHRFVMHGAGIVLHRSHHRRNHRGWERNDAYPVMFAALVCLGFWLGFHEPRLADLVPIGIGITTYGAAYAIVHDVYIHGRLRWFARHRIPLFERLATAHELHHRYNGAPYGMLLPIVPRRLASGRVHDPNGSRPSQVPEPA